MLRHRLRRGAWDLALWRSQRDRLDFYHGLLKMLSYISFPSQQTIVNRLRLIDDSTSLEPLYQAVGEHLGGRTIESAAFCFMLIELVHRHAETVPDLGDFVPRCVFALTGDRELSSVARAALNEIGTGSPPVVSDRPGSP